MAGESLEQCVDGHATDVLGSGFHGHASAVVVPRLDAVSLVFLTPGKTVGEGIIVYHHDGYAQEHFKRPIDEMTQRIEAAVLRRVTTLGAPGVYRALDTLVHTHSYRNQPLGVSIHEGRAGPSATLFYRMPAPTEEDDFELILPKATLTWRDLFARDVAPSLREFFSELREQLALYDPRNVQYHIARGVSSQTVAPEPKERAEIPYAA